MTAPKTRSSWGRWAPTRKWLVATTVAAGTLGTAWAEAGEWSSTLTIAAIGLAVQRLTAYWIPNEEAEA